MSRVRAAVAAFVGFMLLVLSTPNAEAESTPPAKIEPSKLCGALAGTCVVSVSDDGDDGDVDDTQDAGTVATGQRQSGPSAYEIWKKQTAAYERSIREQDAQQERFLTCLTISRVPERCTSSSVTDVDDPGAWVAAPPSGGNAPTLTPDQAGAMAVARLQLPLNAPKIGPDPNINKWKMAAVGYPLWVWADGPTHVGPVSDSVGGLSVSLDAKLTKTVFRMGDGGTVTCRGAGTAYRKGTTPGTPSPDCGHRYEQPSLPKGDYTVTAIGYWAVTWTINGTSGVVTVPRQASTQLPVGEVQVLIR